MRNNKLESKDRKKCSLIRKPVIIWNLKNYKTQTHLWIVAGYVIAG